MNDGTSHGWARRLLGPATTVILLGAAIWLCFHSLRDMRWARLWRDLHAMPATDIVAAVMLTFVSHIALTAYDYIGILYIRSRLSYARVALAAFLAYSISHSLGFAAVTGGAVRYRIYSRWGLGAVEVAQVMAMAGITLFLGMLLIGGSALLFDGRAVAWLTHMPKDVSWAVGGLSIGLVAAYVLLGIVWREPVRLCGMEIRIPGPGFSIMQVVVSSIDWIIVASVLFVLLPRNEVFQFPSFLAVFVLAYLAGVMSNLPGGLGVFESVVLIALTPAVPAEQVVSSLLVYRAVYHILPLAIGGLTFLALEFGQPLRMGQPPRARVAVRRREAHYAKDVALPRRRAETRR